MPTYYVNFLTGTKKPNGLYRFHEDENRSPEFYAGEEGWLPSSNLYLRLMSGEIDDANIVSEEEAMDIARRWNEIKGREGTK